MKVRKRSQERSRMDQELSFAVCKKRQKKKQINKKHRSISFAALSLLLIYPPTSSSDFQMGLLQQSWSYTKLRAVFKEKPREMLLI